MSIYDLWLKTMIKNKATWYDKQHKTSANMDYKLCKYMMKINGYEEICKFFGCFKLEKSLAELTGIHFQQLLNFNQQHFI
jgi:hypothetical protein